jgi:transglutaminase-like putative cysteine protease
MSNRQIHTTIPIILFLCFTCYCSFGKETPKYVVSQIPEEFKQNVNAVFWEDKMVFEIQAEDRASFRMFQAITILNSNGSTHAKVAVFYDKLSKVTTLKGTVYDADGKVIKRVKPSDIHDHSLFDGYTLYSDNRLKEIDLSNGNYPYTIEYEYEVEYRFLFSIPDFSAGDEKISILNSEFTLIYPRELKPQFLSHNIDIKPQVTQLNETTESISWKFKNVKPLTLEPMSLNRSELMPLIEVAPTRFAFDGYKGNMESWNSFGLWINSLNKGRDVLPNETKQKVMAIAKEFPDPKEKVMALYKYMQDKTRYVSIQLGIGGFQPFDATVVDVNGYGDCKALSNYMVSLLSTIGIKAHYVLVYAGRSNPKLKTNFPSSQFNHAIVCVPMERDTIWLECTSQTNPFGYMGSFTGNRKALAITDNGAAIVNTPVYNENHNKQIRTADVVLSDNGNARAKVTTLYAGIQYENGGLSFVMGNNNDGQKKWLQNNTSIPVFDINSFNITEKKNIIPEATVNVDLTLNKFATVSGKRIFLTPNLMNRSSFIPPKVDERKTPVVLRTAYEDIDTINYTVSDQIYPEFLPEPIKFKSRFGEYEATFKLQQGKVTYTRKVIMRQGEFPAESYQELIDFYKSVSRADNTKIVFLNKT